MITTQRVKFIRNAYKIKANNLIFLMSYIILKFIIRDFNQLYVIFCSTVFMTIKFEDIV